MTYGVTAHARRVAGWCIAGLGLSIPISTAGDNVLVALVLIAAAVALPAALSRSRHAVVTIPPVTAAVLLFALLFIACFYGTVPARDGLRVANKYLDLACIPVLLWAASDAKVRRYALAAFGIAVVLNLYVSYSAAAGLPGLRRPEYPIGFKASVTHSLIVSLGAYLFLLAARDAASTRWRWALIALAALCAHNVLFITIGRTGYLVFGLLLAYYIASLFPGRRGLALAAVTVIALAGVVYVASDSLQSRVDEANADLSQYHPGAKDKTSVGQRLEYYRNTLSIVAAHPVLGVGAGAFPQAYADTVRGTASRLTENPHNDYLLIAAQTGIPGLLLLGALYALAWWHAGRLESRLHRDLARGLVIAMAVGGLFNSLLMDHTEGLLFAWLTGVLFAGYNPAHRREAQA